MGIADPLFLILVGLVFVWLATLTVFVWRMLNHYRRLTTGITKEDLKSVLDRLLKDADKGRQQVEIIKKILDEVKKDNYYNIQRIGFVRFNPFADTGGNQSFSLALLDGAGSGLVISSLHSRDNTRVYAKQVKKEKGVGYDLSNEEKMAVKNAKKIR